MTHSSYFMFDRRGRVIAIEMRAMDESRTLDKWEVSLKDLKLVVHESRFLYQKLGRFLKRHFGCQHDV